MLVYQRVIPMRTIRKIMENYRISQLGPIGNIGVTVKFTRNLIPIRIYVTIGFTKGKVRI